MSYQSPESWREHYPESESELVIVESLTPKDIKMGRGSDIFKRYGNKLLRHLCDKRAKEYGEDKSRSRKKNVANKILVELTQGGSRFVREVHINGKKAWVLEVQEKIAEKTKHMLRDKAARGLVLDEAKAKGLLPGNARPARPLHSLSPPSPQRPTQLPFQLTPSPAPAKPPTTQPRSVSPKQQQPPPPPIVQMQKASPTHLRNKSKKIRQFSNPNIDMLREFRIKKTPGLSAHADCVDRIKHEMAMLQAAELLRVSETNPSVLNMVVDKDLERILRRKTPPQESGVSSPSL